MKKWINCLKLITVNILMVNASQFDTMNIIPTWKKFTIETNFRKFIAQLSRNTGFEKWFNLNRNKKYRSLNVDWQSTFYILSDEEPILITSFLHLDEKDHV